MSNKNLFNSSSKPIPELRRDLDIIPVQEKGNAYLYFHDQRQYATPDLALRREAGSLLSLIDGQRSIDDLKNKINGSVSKKELKDFIRFLDEHRLLNSDYFQDFAEEKEARYEQSDLHHSVTAGSSYPADPQELRAYLNEAFSDQDGQLSNDHAKALYAPHIDPRVALDRYAEAFSAIKNLKPKRVVMLGTSHYAGWYPEQYGEHPFILVDKDFKLPLGTIRRDTETISEFSQLASDYGITTQDRAHRMEHSLELHLLFLSYLWDHNFTIVPFLVSDLQELLYKQDGYHGQRVDRFSKLLADKFATDNDTFFLISGDLAHFGKKFGDEQAASHMFEEVENFDRQFLNTGANTNSTAMLNLMKKELDPYRICGFPPLYTFLRNMPNLEGNILNYDLWDERERDSAVTFGSILYQ